MGHARFFWGVVGVILFGAFGYCRGPKEIKSYGHVEFETLTVAYAI